MDPAERPDEAGRPARSTWAFAASCGLHAAVLLALLVSPPELGDSRLAGAPDAIIVTVAYSAASQSVPGARDKDGEAERTPAEPQPAAAEAVPAEAATAEAAAPEAAIVIEATQPPAAPAPTAAAAPPEPSETPAPGPLALQPAPPVPFFESVGTDAPAPPPPPSVLAAETTPAPPAGPLPPQASEAAPAPALPPQSEVVAAEEALASPPPPDAAAPAEAPVLSPAAELAAVEQLEFAPPEPTSVDLPVVEPLATASEPPPPPGKAEAAEETGEAPTLLAAASPPEPELGPVAPPLKPERPLPPLPAPQVMQAAPVAPAVAAAAAASEAEPVAASGTPAPTEAAAAAQPTAIFAPTEERKEARGEAPMASLTAAEIDAFRRQLRDSWQAPAQVSDIVGLKAKVRIVMNPDRTPREVIVVDQARYKSDPLFRVFADSLVAAVWSAGQRRLLLPEEKYALWSVINVTFDLSDLTRTARYQAPAKPAGTPPAGSQPAGALEEQVMTPPGPQGRLAAPPAPVPQ